MLWKWFIEKTGAQLESVDVDKIKLGRDSALVETMWIICVGIIYTHVCVFFKWMSSTVAFVST